MFTGIIKKTSTVRKITPAGGGLLLEIANTMGKVKVGDSITVNGVCSTVKKAGSSIVFEYMPETLRLTTVELLKKGETVNLEQSMRLSDRLDGHLVLGHVDCRGKIVSIKKEGNSRVFEIQPQEKNFKKLMVFKGSVAVDGISLTIARVLKNSFLVKIIPYTLAATNLQYKLNGDSINIEFDIIAKYAAQK